jgi:hypothetical protein
VIALVFLLSANVMFGAQRFPVECRGNLGGGLQWAVKLIDGGKTIRLTLDAHLVDDCLVYSDLEAVVRLLDSRGRALATRRLALPGAVFSRPSISSYRFDHRIANAVSVEGVIMHARKRILRGLPGPGRDADDDPIVRASQGLAALAERERKDYSAWNPALDLLESLSPRSPAFVCGSGETRVSTTQSDAEKACAAVRSQADARRRARESELGPALTPAETER